MATFNTFSLKLLTRVRSVGLRRLRSYAASLSGNASIYTDYHAVKRDVERERAAADGLPAVILLDREFNLDQEKQAELNKIAHVFIYEGSGGMPFTAPHELGPLLNQEALIQCDLPTFLESPVLRTAMAHMCRFGETFELHQLLSWGHASRTWEASSGKDVAQLGIQFIKEFRIRAEWRRLTEMFCHLIDAGLNRFGMNTHRVTFSADGIVMAVIAECEPLDEAQIVQLAEELRIYDFPISILNQSVQGKMEFAAFYSPYHELAEVKDTGLIIFNKRIVLAEIEAEESDIEKAG